MINPNRQDDVSGLGYLCAAGVTMIFIAAVNRRLRQLGWYGEARPEPNMLQWLELVALATVCDVVPLEGPEPRLCHARAEDHGAAREPRALCAGRCRAPEAQARHLMRWASCWGRASMRRAASAMPAWRWNC